jgi:ribosomal protein L37E
MSDFGTEKKGEWLLGFDSQYLEKYYYCSNCGRRKYEEHKPLDNFCSNCGADMRGEKDE